MAASMEEARAAVVTVGVGAAKEAMREAVLEVAVAAEATGARWHRRSPRAPPPPTRHALRARACRSPGPEPLVRTGAGPASFSAPPSGSAASCRAPCPGTCGRSRACPRSSGSRSAAAPLSGSSPSPTPQPVKQPPTEPKGLDEDSLHVSRRVIATSSSVQTELLDDEQSNGSRV